MTVTVTTWRKGFTIPRGAYSARAAESIEKEHERIYDLLSTLAGRIADLRVDVDADAGGDVVGPSSSVDGEIALFDGTTGKLLKAATGTGVVEATAGVYNVTTLDALLDALLGTTQGSVIYRGASDWSALAPGTSGQVLSTQGVGANPQWVAQSGGGSTVCSPLTDGDLTQPELIFASGDVVMVCV